MRKADEALRRVAGTAGYPDELQRMLIVRAHRRFAERFRLILTDGSLKEKFDPLFRKASMEGKESSTQAAILRHIEYQLWLFEAAPALGKEGAMSVQAPLSRIFEPLDCGILKWGEIGNPSGTAPAGEERRDAFDERYGGRQPMLEEVLRLLGDKKLSEPIVLQGVAGSGKSAFTLKLCAALQEAGLQPIRIRMRHLSHESTRVQTHNQ
jgi:hypothetical protein